MSTSCSTLHVPYTLAAEPDLDDNLRSWLAFGAEKGLEMELRQAGLGRGGPEFQRASPFGKMPGFVDGDFAISDSSAIVAYLEAKHPEPSLIPTEPRARARTIWFDELADTIVMAAGGAIFGGGAKALKPVHLGPKNQAVRNVVEEALRSVELGQATSDAGWRAAVTQAGAADQK